MDDVEIPLDLLHLDDFQLPSLFSSLAAWDCASIVRGNSQ